MLLRRHQDSIDAIVAAPAIAAFAERQAAVFDTVHALGLTKGHAVLIGSAGLAAHGLDGQVGDFDVDAVVADAMFSALQGVPGAVSPVGIQQEVHVPGTDVRLPTTGIKGPLSRDFAHAFQANTFDDLNARTISANGVPTLRAAELANAKVSGRGKISDYISILKAHVVAWATEHPITDKPAWREEVFGASYALRHRALLNRDVRRSLPPWLGQLTASDFDHPAFRPLDPGVPHSRAS